MRYNKLSLFIHFVWTTWDRLPLISAEIEPVVFRALQSEAREIDCKVLALGGTEDHVHLLLEIPPTRCILEIVKQLKGVSSRLVNDALDVDIPFKWQASYSAFSVSRWDVKKIAQYIKRQKEHHQAGTTIAKLEETFAPNISE